MEEIDRADVQSLKRLIIQMNMRFLFRILSLLFESIIKVID